MRPPLTAMAICAVALLVTSCADTGADATTSGNSAPPSASSAPAETTPDVQSSPLDGTWSTGQMSMADVAAHLATTNLTQWVEPFMRVDGIAAMTTPVMYTVKLASGQLTLIGQVGETPARRYDLASYAVVDDYLTITGSNGCAGVFRWQLAGEQLHLSLLSDDCPPYDGVPDEVFMKAYYETRPLSPATS